METHILNSPLEKYTFKNFLMFSLSNTYNMVTDFIGISVFYYILKFDKDLVVVSAIGMSFTYTYFIMFFMFGFCEYIGIEGCNLLAEKRYKKFRIFIAQLLVIFSMVSLITIAMGLFCNKIFYFFGFNEDVIEIATPFVRSNLPERLLEPLKQMIVSLIIYFEKQSTFVTIFTISLVQFVLTLLFFNYVIDIGLYSYTISRFIKTSLETYLIWRVFQQNAPQEILQFPDFKNVKKNFNKVFYDCLYSLITIYGEGISNEMTSFFVLRIPSIKQQASWMLYINVNYYTNVFGVGSGQTFRSKFNQLKGLKLYKDIQTLIQLNYQYCFTSNIFLSIIIFILRKQIAQTLTFDLDAQNYLQNLICIYIFFMPFLINKFSIGSLVRSMGYFNYTFKLSGLFYPLTVFICIYFGQKFYHIEVYTILVIYLCTDLIVYLALTVKYLQNKHLLQELLDDNSKSQNLIELDVVNQLNFKDNIFNLINEQFQ